MSRHSFDTVTALKQAGYLPIVITLDSCEKPVRSLGLEGIKVIRLWKAMPGKVFNNYLFNVLYFFAVGFWMTILHRPRAMLANTWAMSGISVYLLSKCFGAPYFIFCHGLDVSNPEKNKKVDRCMRAVLSRANRVIAISNFTKQLVSRQVVEGAGIEVIYPAIDIERFNRPGPDSVKKIDGRREILTIARLVEHKGQDMVIRSLPEVIAKVPDIIYRIVGDGPKNSDLRLLVDELKLNDHVRFEGNVPDEMIPGYYQACDVFIMVSREEQSLGAVEGFGIVYLEAGACAKPVIGSRSGGIVDAVEEGVTGLLVDPLSLREISSALIRILSDNDLAQTMGNNGMNRVRAQFDLKQYSGKLSNILNNGIDKKQ